MSVERGWRRNLALIAAMGVMGLVLITLLATVTTYRTRPSRSNRQTPEVDELATSSARHDDEEQGAAEREAEREQLPEEAQENPTSPPPDVAVHSWLELFSPKGPHDDTQIVATSAPPHFRIVTSIRGGDDLRVARELSRSPEVTVHGAGSPLEHPLIRARQTAPQRALREGSSTTRIKSDFALDGLTSVLSHPNGMEDITLRIECGHTTIEKTLTVAAPLYDPTFDFYSGVGDDGLIEAQAVVSISRMEGIAEASFTLRAGPKVLDLGDARVFVGADPLREVQGKRMELHDRSVSFTFRVKPGWRSLTNLKGEFRVRSISGESFEVSWRIQPEE